MFGMAITNTLSGLPLINQLTEPSGDSGGDNNARENCVAASVCAGLTYLLKRPFYGDALKDSVYGENYTGGQMPAHYVSHLASLGVALTPYNSTSGWALVNHIFSELKAGCPVVLTMPSRWGIPPADPLHPAGTTHVGIACGWGPGWIRVMNPWGGFWQDGDFAYWAARLCFGQVWSMALSNSGKANVSSMWKAHGSGAVDGAGHTVGAGLAGPLIAANAPDGKRSETPFTAAGDVFVDLADGQVWTWTHADNAARSDRGGLVIEALESQIATLQAQLAAAGKSGSNDTVAKACIAAVQAQKSADTAMQAAIGEL